MSFDSMLILMAYAYLVIRGVGVVSVHFSLNRIARALEAECEYDDGDWWKRGDQAP